MDTLKLEHLGVYEMTTKEKFNTEGGTEPMTWIAIAAYVAALNETHSLGESVGKALYRITH